MSIPSLRNKQIAEVLDVWRNINRQVFNREKKQVSGWLEGVVPKTQRDLDAEVGIDKLLEQINKAIDAKLVAFDLFLTKGADDSASLSKLQQEIVATGDVIILWNSIARIYTKTGISRQSQELIKVKLVNIQNGIDALVYGSNKVVDNFTTAVNLLIDQDETEKAKVLFKLLHEIINMYGVYALIQRQIKSGTLSVIEPPDVSAEVEDYIATKSDVFQTLMAHADFQNFRNKIDKDIKPRFNLRSRYLPSQLKQIQDEYGLRPARETHLAIAKLKAKDAVKMLDTLKAQFKDPMYADMKQRLIPFLQEQKDLEAEHFRLESSMRSWGIDLDRLRERIQDKEDAVAKYQAQGLRWGRIANGLDGMRERAVNLDQQIREGGDRLGEIEERDTELMAEIEHLVDQISKTATDVGFIDENPEPEMRRRVINEQGRDYWGRADPFLEEEEDEKHEGRGRGLATMDDDYFEECVSSSDSESDEEYKFVPYKALPYTSARNDFYRLHKGK